MQQKRNEDYQGTQLTGNLEQYFRNEIREPVAAPEAPPVTPVSPSLSVEERKKASSALPGMIAPELRRLDVRAKLHAWWLSDGRTRIAILDPEKALGAIVCSDGITTSPIVAYDRTSRRIYTRSGNVYELGMPEAFFAAKGRLILKCMGF